MSLRERLDDRSRAVHAASLYLVGAVQGCRKLLPNDPQLALIERMVVDWAVEREREAAPVAPPAQRAL